MLVTAGRRIADTEKEQVQIAVDEFNRTFGTAVLKELARLVIQPGPFTLRLQIHGNNHRVERVQLQPDWTISLDGTGEE